MPFLAPIAAAVITAVEAVATVVSAVAANAALALGAGSALTATVSTVAFGIAETALIAGPLIGISHLLKVGGGDGGGMQVAFKADPQAGVPYLIGRTATGGNIVFSSIAGPNNQDLTYVTVLSAGGPINQVESFSAAGYVISFSGGGAFSSVTGTVPGFAPVQNNGSPVPFPSYSGKMWQKTQLGAAGAAALSISGPAMPPEWTSAHQLSGMAASMWTLRSDTKLYSTGTPKALWVCKGAPAYDPRLDSTYPGGSGSQRSFDRTTWTYTENPFLHGLAWLLGVTANGVRVLGVGAAILGIDVAGYVTGANVADANGWKVGGVVYSTDNKYDVLISMLQAGGGFPLKLGARISCFVNQPLVSLDTLEGRDVVGPVTIQGTTSRKVRINTVWPSYREESVGWEITPTQTSVSVSAYFTTDSGPRSREVKYLLVQDPNQVSQLARYDIENSREFGPVVLPCKTRWLGYKPGDAITVDEPEFGLNGQKVVILKRSLDPQTLAVTLTVRSETDGKHPFALGQTGDPPPTPGLTGVDPSWLDGPGAVWTMTGSSFVGAGEAPCLLIDGACDNPNATDIIVDYRQRLTPTPTWGPWQQATFNRSATRLAINGVVDSAYYGAQVRYKTRTGVDDFNNAFNLGVVQVGEIHITDEGLLATLDAIEDAQLKAGVDVNCLVDTDFSQGSNWWRPDGDSTVTGTYPVSANGVPWAKVVNTGGAPGQQIRFGSDNQVNSLPIKPGDYIGVSAVVGVHGCSSVFIEARWLNAAGANIGGVPQATVLQTVTAPGAGGGEIDTGTRIGGFAQAPSGAYRVMFVVVGVIAAGGSGNDWIFVAEPMLAKARSGSGDLAPFNPGFRGEPGADVTSGHTAAAITGQGPWATSHVYRQATAPASGMVSQDVWFDTTATPNVIYIYDQSSTTWVKASPTQAAEIEYATGGTIESLKPGEAGANVTATHTAAAITGQGPWATSHVYRQTTAPASGMVSQDVWFDTSVTPNIIYIYDASTPAWVKASPTQASEIKYASGATTESLKPGEAAADVTGGHTAAALVGQTDWTTWAHFAASYNQNPGQAATRSVDAPLSAASHTQIDVAAHTFYYPDASGTTAGGSILGLTASTAYNLFDNAHTGAFSAVSGSAQAYFDDPTATYIWLGGQTTPDVTDTTYPTFATPSGTGGATSSWNPLRVFYNA